MVSENSSFWDKLAGNKAEFSMENRAYNVVSVITFGILVYSFIFDLFIGQVLMSWIIVVLFIILSFLYYYSRTKKKYKYGLTVYAFCSYAALIVNYIYDGGIAGPTLYFFGLMFLMLIAISSPKLYILWIVLHISVVSGLMLSEYLYPGFVGEAYDAPLTRFLDILAGYVAMIIFVFFITNYLRKYYHEEKRLSAARLQEILAQNEQIMLQNTQLAKINEEKNKLFSIVSHDLRGPVDSITGYLDVLSESLIDENERKEIEFELSVQTKYTSDMLQNLLYWARAQMNGVTPNLLPIKLAELIEESRSHKMNKAAKKGIILTYDTNDDVNVVADKEMLRIVLRNVVNNAIKFTHPGGEVVIKLIQKAGVGAISVKDTGIGMHDEKQKEIFTLKSDSTYGTNNEKGMGLGLMLCKEFMNYQKGDIRFESKTGQGSIFYIELPLA